MLIKQPSIAISGFLLLKNITVCLAVKFFFRFNHENFTDGWSFGSSSNAAVLLKISFNLYELFHSFSKTFLDFVTSFKTDIYPRFFLLQRNSVNSKFNSGRIQGQINRMMENRLIYILSIIRVGTSVRKNYLFSLF